MRSTVVLALATFASVAACGNVYNLENSDSGVRRVDAGPPLDIGTIVSLDPGPPPLSGGTLALTRDHQTAVAADPDHDQIFLVGLQSRAVRTLTLHAHDEPGRTLEGPNNTVFVALRGHGEVLAIDVPTASISATYRVCAAPRGLAFDAPNSTLHVACAGGELVSVSTTDGAITRTLRLDPDLRDVIIDGDYLLVTRFRAAEMLVVAHDGSVSRRLSPPSLRQTNATTHVVDSFSPAVAWRAVPYPAGGALVIHQREQDTKVNPPPSVGYYGTPTGCATTTPIVHTAATILSAQNVPSLSPVLNGSVLPVDVAVAENGAQFAFVSASNAGGSNQVPNVFVAAASVLTRAGCLDLRNPTATNWSATVDGQPVAVSFLDTSSRVVVQTRVPTALYILEQNVAPTPIPLAFQVRDDSGHMLFHRDFGTGLVCASCHPEAGDDGHTWDFGDIGPRRTQNLRGGLLSTAPFHWDGRLGDMNALMDEVFVNRMRGRPMTNDQASAVGHWIDQQAAIPATPPVDADQIARGQRLFNDSTVACASCHAGAHFTNNATVDVGTGGRFQIPSLVGVSARLPLMHTGCAHTLRDRFTASCGGGEQHGHTSHLTAGQLDDLTAYLQSL